MSTKFPIRSMLVRSAFSFFTLIAIFVASRSARKKAGAGRASKKEVNNLRKAKAKAATKKVAAKKTAKSAATKKTKPVTRKKAPVKAKAKPKPETQETSGADYGPAALPLAPGPDLHLIPVRGEIHPARTEDAPQFEKAYDHNETVAFNQEQQRVKQIAGSAKRVYKNPRQS